MPAEDVLEWVGRRRLSTPITFEHRGTQRSLIVESGAIVWASSNRRDEQLGAILVRSGIVAERALADALEARAETGVPLGPWPFPTRTHGVVEKCTFCFHRIDKALREGKKVGTEVVPACVEDCPAEARKFGDLDDTRSEVSGLLASRGWIRLREELDTNPKVYYLLK